MISKNQIKYIQSLHSKKNREEEGLFIVEGIKLVTEFIQHQKFEILELFATADYVHDHSQLLSNTSFKFSEVTTEELKKISLLTSPNQVLAIAKITVAKLNADLFKNTTSLFLDDIRDPGNLGTIIRIADWFGIKQVICSPTSTEVYNPKTLQASMGAILRVEVISMPFSELLNHAINIPVYGALLEGSNVYTTALKHGLIVIGNEANGISTEVVKHITEPITIPAAAGNGSESLNAANACAIICSEFHRQLNYRS
ncbi:MAG: putative tRNA/rRNA methyltransferase [Bacteroidota bacterium]|jgi:TrmH family RNA methyltransferase|nr:putative tRNA/rRNA methyltransferase [Bacteroidota bacterium]